MNDPRNLEAVVFRGIESDELDYKAHQNWNQLSRTGKGKIVRHLLALANTKGGFLVIGVGEDAAGRPVLQTGMSEEESASFDPTPVGGFINRCVEPPIDFTIERPVIQGKRYVIFVVRPFAELPHVCCNGVDTELQTGVFYIRTPEASSRPASRALEMQQLIQRALRNQREQLGKILRGILYETRTGENEQQESRAADQMREAESFFLHRIKPGPEISLLQLSFLPLAENAGSFDLSFLRRAVSDSLNWLPASFFLGADDMTGSYITNTSLRYLSTVPVPHLWQLFRSGLFHYIAVPEQKNGIFHADHLAAWCAEAVAFAGKLYAELGYSEELFAIHLTLSRMEEKKLHLGGKECGVCRIPQINVEFKRSAADLAVGVTAHGARLLRGIAERFNCSDETISSLCSSMFREGKHD